MGAKFKVVKRPPMERLIASWLDFPEIANFQEFTLRGEHFKGLGFFVDKTDKPDEWLARIQINSLIKSDAKGTIPGSIWFFGETRAKLGGCAVYGCVTPHNRNSWIKLCDAPGSDYFLDRKWAEEIDNHEFFAAMTSRAKAYIADKYRLSVAETAKALQTAEAISLEHYGNPLIGDDIVFAVLERMAKSS